MTDRLTTLKTVLWALVGVLLSVTGVRFAHGLGAVTNLSDAAPWGLWIGFDVMSGVALAAGGFVLAGTVYIFGLERYRPFVRAAILTALLGYAAVAVGLLYDLGLPWRIWHPILHWQYHSVLFEVAMCVMLYLAVLSLEFAPVVLEHPLFSHPVFRAVLSFLRKVTIPLVIAGIVLSTLHQSSLGSLFLITPYRLHPLWYSPIIYVLYFVSAVGLGLMMVVLESLFSFWFLGHKVDEKLVAGLGKAASVVLFLYLGLRLGDLAYQGVLLRVLDGSWQSALFVAELAVSAAIPATLMAFSRVRSRKAGMATAAGMTVAGMIMYRIDTSIVAFARPEGMGYFPSWMEIAVSVGIVAAFALVFIFFVEHLRVYDHIDPPKPRVATSYDPATLHRLLPGSLARPRIYSMAVLTGAVVVLPFLPLMGVPPVPVPVQGPRTVEAFLEEPEEAEGELRRFVLRAGGEEHRAVRLLLIDGNRDGNLVLFDHDDHAARLGEERSCVTCHHLNLPLDRNSSCSACHRDMYDSTSVFDHTLHAASLGGNQGCGECHGEGATIKSYGTVTTCTSCHQTEIAQRSFIGPPPERWGKAVSYIEAMHGVCVPCHEREALAAPEHRPGGLARCMTCHNVDWREEARRMAPRPGGGDRMAGGGGAPSPGGR